MKRKLVKQGAATMMVSLPAKWIQKNKLGKGDEVDVDVLEDSLLVSAEKKDVKKETVVKVVGLEESSVRTIITNTYRLGYDRVKIFFRAESQFKIIDNVMKTQLLGFDLIKKEKDYCIIENITEPSYEQFDVLMQKMLYSVTELLDISESKMKGQPVVEGYQEIEARIKRYDNFCKRVISKESLTNKNPQLFWTFLTLLTHGQRQIYLMLNALYSRKAVATKDDLVLLKECRDVFNMLKQAYLKKDIGITERIHELEKKIIYQQGYKILKKKKGAIVAHHLMNASRIFYLASSPLIGMIVTQ